MIPAHDYACEPATIASVNISFAILAKVIGPFAHDDAFNHGIIASEFVISNAITQNGHWPIAQ
eukprot:1267414-Karenia_brevis.AAC.1